jgi:diguanylate cyclase (GGDEF)-like protein/PAS domain S-box-containing protein
MSDPSGPAVDRLRPERLRHVTLWVLGAYTTAVVLVAVAAMIGLDVQTAVQSYVRGESLWSKAQKEAVLALDEYAAGAGEAYWDRYLESLAVPLGDRTARLELSTPDPDPDVVRRGFLQGGLHPAEIDGMIRLHRWFSGWAPMRRALDRWAEGDSLIAELHRQAGHIRREFELPPPDTQAVIGAMDRVEALNRELHQAELGFSMAMSEASRAAHRWFVWFVAGLSALLLVGGGGVSWLLYRVVHDREDALRSAEQRYRSIFENSQDAIYVTGVDGTIMEINPAGMTLFGYSREEFQGLRAQDLYHDPADRERFRRRIAEEGEIEGFEVQLETRDGRVLDCELTSTTRVENAEVTGYQGIIRDVTERKQIEEELERQALHDFLTGLPNRALLWDRLEQAVARAARGSAGPLAVLFVDLDRFKVVNDSLSHAAGDQVLIKVSRRLEACVREPDTVARVGGDEFVVLLESLQVGDEAEMVADRIQRAFEPPFPVAGEKVHLDVSIGIALLEPEEARELPSTDTVDELVRQADSAMYRAKGRRGTGFARYVPQRDEERQTRVQRENELRRAIDAEEFLLHYQPIVSLPDGRIAAAEPLVRWQHPERGLLPPEAFLPLADETGLILSLGAWVLEASCRQVAEWNRELRPDDPLFVHPNLSALQFEDPELEERLEGILRAAGLPARYLEVEVTEHSVMQAPTRTRALADLGVGVCIDDFGTGYSSLSYVRELAADALKIDMSFVHGIGESQADEAIIRTILTLGRSLELDVVAEGVETGAQRSWLEREGCPWAQGFHFGRPVTAAEFRELLEEAGS